MRSLNLRPHRCVQRYECSSKLSDRRGRPFIHSKRLLISSPECADDAVTRDINGLPGRLLNCRCGVGVGSPKMQVVRANSSRASDEFLGSSSADIMRSIIEQEEPWP